MNLNDLLEKEGIDPKNVLVFRHRPQERAFNKIIGWLAAERPNLYNVYQSYQGPNLERTMEKLVGSGYVASFIRDKPGRALFVGLYFISRHVPMTSGQLWQLPENKELLGLGFKGGQVPQPTRTTVLFFDLQLLDFYSHWKGKMVIAWPPPERSWWRRAHRNEFPIIAVHEDSALTADMPDWRELVLTWEELKVLPQKWKDTISQWRGIYHIFDISDGKAYVGSAYGEENILGRWLNYADTGHGGNRLLRRRDPKNLRFTILERVSPDMHANDVIRAETSWKKRLHTYHPFGLNDN